MQSINREYSEKSYIVAVCLVGIFGTLGFHHFYVNRWIHGLFDLSLAVLIIAFIIASELYIWFLLSACILFLIDFIHTVYFMYKLIVGEYMDGKGKPISYNKGQIW